MKIALLMNKNSYAGREYVHTMIKNKIHFDVISINKIFSFSQIEDLRTNNNWKPEKIENMIQKIDNFYSFSSMTDPKLIEHLLKEKYQLGIQGGGVGIIKKIIINKFKLGILNFHPGNLPHYQGCSAPERQLLDGNEIIATCHLIDTGIDTGDILSKKKLSLQYHDYHLMRAKIYPEMALFLIDVLREIIKKKTITIIEYQNMQLANYSNYIGDKSIENLKIQMKEGKVLEKFLK